MSSSGTRTKLWVLASIGMAAGLASGIFGVGGGIVMVPLLVGAVHLSEHEAHATSLLAILPIATAGALVFAFGEGLALGYAALLALGSMAGAPIGARLLAGADEGTLKIAFGAFMIVVGVLLVIP